MICGTPVEETKRAVVPMLPPLTGGYSIPFNRPCFVGGEEQLIAESMANMHISGDGPFTKKCHALIEELLGVKKALLTTSCTHALEMTALLLDFKDGDEVIVPSFTFVSTINAFVLRGAKPVFVDIRPDTLNMDEQLVKGAITSRTKAIVPVHYAGVGCEMDEIISLATNAGVAVIEDNAHGFLGEYNGRKLGTFGSMSTLSFHETKNFHCGEGGALLINDESFIERAEIIREKGTNRTRFFRGQVDKYSWVDVGSSYLPSDLLAAILFAQLRAHETIQSKRARIWNFYLDNLTDWAKQGNVTLPTVPGACQQPYHMFYLLLPSLAIRQALIAHLRERGILAIFHYLPLHLSEMGRKYGGQKGDCPVTEEVSDRILRLPFYNNFTEDDQVKVIEAILQFDRF
jgi:dTDP-4-amino-4,6-dideoxygalactose transaminase